MPQISPPPVFASRLAAKSGFSLPETLARARPRLLNPGDPRSTEEKSASAGRPMVLCAPAGHTVDAALEIAGLWIRAVLELGGPGSLTAVVMESMASRKISGLLVRGSGKKTPRAVRVTTLPARGSLLGTEPPPANWTARQTLKGNSSANSRRQLRPSHRTWPFVPIYLAGVASRSGRSARSWYDPLAPRRLVAGRVAVEGARFEPSKTRVRLRPKTASGAPPDPRLAAQREGAELEVAARGDGFFQFVGVPPGSWELEAEQAPLAPARYTDLRVEPEAETVLPEPLVLRPKEALALRIDPPLDWSGRRWKVSVRRRVEGTDRLESAWHSKVPRTPMDGTDRVRRAGPLCVSVKDARGQIFFPTSVRPGGRRREADRDSVGGRFGRRTPGR